MNSPKPKRVVSKAEYRRYLRKKWLLTGLRHMALFLSGFSVFALLLALYVIFVLHHWLGPSLMLTAVCMMAIFVSPLCAIFFKRHLKALEPVEPVSRHNIDRLPAAEALVRGSDAPHTPETVLLRAAQEQETPQEHLLRATE